MATTNGPQGWRQQSPIDIQKDETWRVQPAPSYLRLATWRSSELVLTKEGTDTHHPWYSAKLSDGNAPTFSFAGRAVVLEQIHFHVGSEHHVDGVEASGEIHLVHAIGGDEGGSTKLVIGVLVEGAQCAGTGSAPPNPVPLSALLPASDDWYRYEGSLTTGAHAEIVSWVVMAQPVILTTELASTLCAANHGDREPQPLQRRFVLRNFG